MRSKTINPIKYSGTVTLSQSINGKKFIIKQLHNRGTNKLFNFFSECLIGDFDVAKLHRPDKLMLLEEYASTESQSGVNYLSKSKFISMQAAPEIVDEDRVRYSFIVGRDYLSGSSFTHIGLYSKSATSADEFAAICQIDDISDSTSASSVLVIDWELKLTNSTEGDY